MSARFVLASFTVAAVDHLPQLKKEPGDDWAFELAWSAPSTGPSQIRPLFLATTVFWVGPHLSTPLL
jgi:hypothetical protein